MSATPRLYVTPDLGEGLEIPVDSDQAHYLTRVMRLAAGDPVRVFNGRHGEFDASLAASTKSTATLKLGQQTRQQQGVPDVWLLFAPLKKARTDFVVEKATELGASEILPVLTERTDADTVRTDRLQRIAIEAAEQAERLDVPRIHEAAKLPALLASWKPDRVLIYADEAGEDAAKPWGGEAGRAAPAASGLEVLKAPAAILIGPEGGFSPAERKRLRELPYVRPVSLGPRILRAETAAVAALALYQALAGDWRS
ncbi:MAG: 16S rRNA (uracil(1498)-N(3))-methyltransferase [Hyphomonadaceae bacterium]|nr:16S rRNA (uracil(1498)-N(3))-methyltransferase [Hyphomonadaceae bacterium]